VDLFIAFYSLSFSFNRFNLLFTPQILFASCSFILSKLILSFLSLILCGYVCFLVSFILEDAVSHRLGLLYFFKVNSQCIQQATYSNCLFSTLFNRIIFVKEVNLLIHFGTWRKMSFV
jgi:hypothetical protein